MIKGGNPIRSELWRLSETKQKSAGSIYVIRRDGGAGRGVAGTQRHLKAFKDV